MMAGPGEQEKIPHVLIVEDDAAHRLILSDLLQEEGFVAAVYSTAREALEDFRKGEFAVAILDHRLPDLAGTQVLERLRAVDDTIQVIMHTAYGSFASARDAVNFGAFAFVEKGGKPEELLRQVHRAAQSHMRQALLASEERYRHLAELSPVGIFHTDAGGTYRYVNRRWSEITGLTSEEVLRDGWRRGLHPDDRERVLEEWRQAVADSHPFRSEFRFRHADGQTTWVYGQARPEMNGDGRVTGYVGTVTDISQRKEAEESLRLLESALEQALIPVAVTIAGSDEPPKYVYVNPAFARMTGYAEGELLGKPPSVLYGLKTSRTVLDRLESLQSQGRSFVGDMILYRQDGSTFAIEARIDAVKDGDGRITHWVAIYR